MGGKKAKPPKDFQKKKLKLGVKAVPTNHTDLSFKAKSINIPSQTIVNKENAVKKDDIANALSHLTNASRSARLEALKELSGLFTSMPSDVVWRLGDVLKGLIPVVLDKNDDVRKKLRETLASLVSICDEVFIKPFVNFIVAYLSSGLNHIDEDIRMDSVFILRTFIDKYTTIYREHAHEDKKLLQGRIDVRS
ncbi:Testis-expressed sequence 10 protein [Phlyctochytrium planicorne]|nr:Testis-expressed sequence 10 protein [Phlyctochytrium planicorne]